MRPFSKNLFWLLRPLYAEPALWLCLACKRIQTQLAFKKVFVDVLPVAPDSIYDC